MRGSGTALLVLPAVVAVALVGCAPPPATGPGLAVGDRPGPPASDRDGADPDARASAPDWLPPSTDLPWGPCGGRPDRALPADARLECAGLGDTAVVRLTTARTPTDAPPLVVVPGPEDPADAFAARFAAAGGEVTDSRPVVVLDHRGRDGAAGSCLTAPSRETLAHLADRGADPGSPEARGALADVAQECTDALVGRELHFGSVHAADDLDALREAWDVPGLAVLGVGAGARTAVAYASTRPDRVALLALDSPAPLVGDQEAAARAALDGSDTALRMWASSCSRPQCGPGDATARVDAITRALDEARAPDATVPAALLSDVIRSALGDLAGASSDAPAPGDLVLGALAGARDGTVPAAVRARATELARGALPFVAGCSDLDRRVPVNRVVELADEWSSTPPFGEILAAQLSACSTWPVPSPGPVALTGPAPVWLASGVADPVAGAGALEPTAGLLTAVGAREVHTVTWGSPGSRALLHSSCARTALADFLADPAGAESDTACPS